MNHLDAVAVETDWLIGGGAMATLIKTKDWSHTALGPIESWPPSLRTVVSLVQASSSPISLVWGPQHIQIYNDGYWPICGDKHPRSMGQDFRECWRTAWPVIGEAYAQACTGRTAYLENMRLFVDRYGFLEETWFTFSFSPITDESGDIAGLFHPVTELTGQSLAARRLKVLRDLAAVTGKCTSAQEVVDAAVALFGESNLDLPFVAFYLLDDGGRMARQVARSGLPAETPLCPAEVDLQAPAGQHSAMAEAVRCGEARPVDDVSGRLGGASVGPYPEVPCSAMILPILLPGLAHPAGVIVAGVSARLRMNDEYGDFLNRVAATVASGLANARAHEDERRKAAALAAIDRAKTAFFSNVSHEFRTPLTLMLGPLEDELQEHDPPLTPLRRERIEIAHRNSLRLLKLVNGLLDFSRLEAGRVQALYEPSDLSALTADLASCFRSAVERAGLEFVVECPPLPQPIYVDREMWEKIVLNLLSNALKHTFAGAIRVSTAMQAGAVELTVEDSGVGIAADDIPRLFQRFQRIKGAASRSHEGTGIGLSLVRQFAELHGGSVRLESTQGVGSRFVVTLPSGSAHLPAEQIGRSSPPAGVERRASAFVEEALHWLPPADVPAEPRTADADSPPADRPHTAAALDPRPRILWADDNADMRRYVAQLLGGLYEVNGVADGLAALEAARTAPPDLVLSDVMMPGLDGFELLAALRADERTRRLPVILLSARAGEEAALEGLAAGADEYLVKPFSAKELLARVRSCLALTKLRQEWETRLEQTNQQLREAVLVKDRFLATMSHEIRTPLNAVIGMAELLANTALTAQQRDFADTIRSSGDHLLCVINDILDFSKLDSGKTVVEDIPFRVADVVRSALDMVAAEAHRKGLELAHELLPQVPEVVLGDPARVRQVLLNLLSNAVKFTARGEVLVTVQAGEAQAGRRELIFTVRDTGIGLTREECGRLFLAFSQADHTTSRKYGGTGLGLAISRKLAELMAGRIWVESEIGRGSTFHFSILAGCSTAGAIVERPADARTAPAANLAQRHPLRILVAEDNPINVKLITIVLENMGYAAAVAGNGVEALAALRRETYDVVLMDVWMPEMDGIEATRRILREWPAGHRPRIVALTAGVLPEERQACLAAGIDEVLHKPLSTADLLKALQRCPRVPAAALPADRDRSAARG